MLEIDNKKFAANLIPETTLETSEELGELGDENTKPKTSEEMLEFYESRLKSFLRRTNSSDIIADLFLGQFSSLVLGVVFQTSSSLVSSVVFQISSSLVSSVVLLTSSSLEFFRCDSKRVVFVKSRKSV